MATHFRKPWDKEVQELAFHWKGSWRGGNAIVILCFNFVNGSIFRESLNQQQGVLLGIMKELHFKAWRKRLLIFVPKDLGLRSAWHNSTESGWLPRLHSGWLELLYNLRWLRGWKSNKKSLSSSSSEFFLHGSFYFDINLNESQCIWVQPQSFSGSLQ